MLPAPGIGGYAADQGSHKASDPPTIRVAAEEEDEDEEDEEAENVEEEEEEQENGANARSPAAFALPTLSCASIGHFLLLLLQKMTSHWPKWARMAASTAGRSVPRACRWARAYPQKRTCLPASTVSEVRHSIAVFQWGLSADTSVSHGNKTKSCLIRFQGNSFTCLDRLQLHPRGAERGH